MSESDSHKRAKNKATSRTGKTEASLRGKPRKVLQVPQKDMAKAAKTMENTGISGTVKKYERHEETVRTEKEMIGFPHILATVIVGLFRSDDRRTSRG